MSCPVEIPAENSLIQVVSHKYDGSRPKRWPARVLSLEDDLLSLAATFPAAVQHPQMGFIPQGTASLEYYWLTRWYNVFCFLRPDGQILSYYCNINLPPSFDGTTLTYTDLDLDLWVTPDGHWQVLDEEEFATNARHFSYPPELSRNAFAAVHELLAMVTRREFPFSGLLSAHPLKDMPRAE
jgi:protein associated with RNAse G/E